ncbi:hypothetical protein SAMN05216410_2622 [Sanguibacter gelidistatuariae]|uniref:Protein kinase domain-containing protein n=1 Tax=Sanguibacter gelidistatuariae TaxID=1814289 RepID=A0A1G6R8G4_9MICO|nr:hypothetical protein [Sanguibacter gelidistatuariae]SDD00713.1 hypothetical protein SAMN05216410_2622 [Sanguibacter gelidistatuariae]
MDAELTPERQDRLAEAGYVVDLAPGHAPVRGRLRVRDGAGCPFDLELVALPDGARETHIAHLSRWFPINDSDVEQLVDALDLDDAIGYLTAPAAPTTLETFVEANGRLGAGHTSTLLVTLGRTLARLHAQGVAYGPIHARDVLVVAGRVVLTVPKPDLARAAIIAASPQEDAYHLAALADSVIDEVHGPQAPARPPPGLRGLAKLIVSAMGDAKTRPGVGTLATLSHDLAPCLPLVPVEQVESVPRAAPRPGTSTSRGAHGVDAGRSGLDRRVRRRKAFRGSMRDRTGLTRDLRSTDGRPRQGHDGDEEATAARAEVAGRPRPRTRSRGVGVLVLSVVAAGVGTGAVVVDRLGTDAPAYAVAIEETPATDPGAAQNGAVTHEDPGAAAARLTRTRMDRVVALTNAVQPAEGSATPAADGDAAADDGWADVVLPGSAAHTQAVDLVAGLRADRAQITGLTVETEPPVVLAQSLETAQVEVTFSISAYTLESTSGVQEIAAGGSRTAVLDLVLTGAGWLVAGVSEIEVAT